MSWGSRGAGWRGAQRAQRRRRRLRWSLVCGAPLALAAVALSGACATLPPARPDDLCAIFDEKPDWYEAAVATRERWRVPESVQLAILHQESRFRHDARPPRGTFLWVFPGARPSSAYGYGQILDSTWREYRRDHGGLYASRADFADVVDFIGWYASIAARQSKVPPSDAFRLYLSYHEGHAGFRSGRWRDKTWLVRVARKVQARAARYERQYAGCRERLAAGNPWYLPF